MASTQFAYRTQKAIGVVNGPPTYEALQGFKRPEGNLRCCTYSPDGKWFAWATQEDVKVVLAETGEIETTLPAAGVHEIGFSPRGSYIITWERPSKQEDGNASKNLKVWKTETAEPVTAFVQKSQVGWNLQYTYDEKYCARAVTNTIQFFEPENMSTVWNHLRVEGVTEFALSPGKNYSIAVFIAERKGAPAIVRTYTVPDFTNPTSQKSFFKADKITMTWNDLGTQVLILTQTDVDKTGMNYYGETNLYLMSAAGNFDCRVTLDKDGPIHDVTWSPNSKEFGVVYGSTPAKTTIFDLRANVIHSLPLGPRNTIKFSPHGRFVIVAGFGNMQGQMDIYDRERNMTKITTIEASNSSVCEWSPDGQHILTATTSPRLRVDNGVKIWHFSGPLVYLEELNELYNVLWRPQPVTEFPLGNPFGGTVVPHASAATHKSTTTPLKPAGAYRPPHARGSVTPLHFKREDEGGASHSYLNGNAPNPLSNLGKPRRRDVPGAAPADKPADNAAPLASPTEDGAGLSKAALKNKKKREAAKKAKELAQQQQQQGGAAPQGQAQGQNGAPAAQLTVDGKPVPTGPSSERQGRDGNRNHRGDRSRSRNNHDSPHRGGPGQNGPPQARRSKSRNNDPNAPAGAQNNKHQRGQSGDVRNHLPSQSSNNGANPQTSAPASQSPSSGPSGPALAPTAATPKANSASPAPGLTLTVPTGVAGPLSPIPGTPSTTEEKKLRGLHKKLRAIEDLKMRLAAGEKLEDTQMKKIATEDGVKRELEMFGGL
ncbi:eukaryotic translation initiation factor eIF2A-domain-containing protein [Peziza echinospora]|nr:eukaryotic translation initiation factor eIF2A-domain-containing protein [Peziza echinospora]